MKQLKDYISEKLKINSNTKYYVYYPEDEYELKQIIKERLKKDKNANLNDIDVSKIERFDYLFTGGKDPYNIDISEWDVSNMKSAINMFYYCENFNSDLSKWNVSNLKLAAGMFYGCKNFNCDLSKWDVSNVEIMSNMFNRCQEFNSDLSQWDVSNCFKMDFMFTDCLNFDSDLSNWNTKNVKDKDCMFIGCKKLKKIPEWKKS